MTTFETIKEEHKKYMERNNMTECCVREMTLIEEIETLAIDQDTKKRIIEKAERLIDENHQQGEFLYNCHNEIDRLKNAIVSQAKMIGSLEEEVRAKGVNCGF